MTAAAYKLDDGQNYAANCFPARTLLHRRKEGAGHWLVAYRKAQEQNYRNLHRRIKGTCRKSENKRGTDAPHSRTLDGLFLLQLHCVDKPCELCSVDVSERKLNSVKQDDLEEFVNVAYIDASINSLSLESFSRFGSLKELNLSLNGLCNMTTHAADFPLLEVLDLSYNSLSADAILSIGRLPRLKVLHLTANQIHHLPPNLGSSNTDATQLPPPGEDTQFESLEVLMLDDNQLSSAVFNSLTNLKRLKYLNLQGNRISEIPCLQLMGCSVEERGDEEGPAHAEPNPNTDEHFRRISQVIHKQLEEYCRGSCLPLPALQFLNLADNKIAEEEALMAAALFPALREIDIHSNPLTTQRSGDPPILTYYLHERLGITIKRKKMQEAVKLPLKVFTDPKWKVEERIPKVSKKRVLNEALEKRETTVKTDHFFVTQAADVPKFGFDLQPDDKEAAETRNKSKAVTVPKEFPCYEMLMDEKPNPDVVESVGIQTAVRMLEHTLKSLNVYRDAKPKLNSIQTAYREREKRIKKLPPVRLTKQPTERVDEMIKALKETSSIRAVPLSSAINRSSVTKQDYKEAQSLLREMKTKYKMVHKRTMEQVASIECERNRDTLPPVNSN
uniref:X-ray radiation resistance-associated protein 1 n=1 Tax=Semicossyphus pulcher TaxID=241346 RepID=UPI0037E99803